MYIALCDDDPQLLHQLAAVMEEYVSARRCPLQYRLFDDAQAMLGAAAEKPFTHYFLDVMMPGMDGIAAAQEIRRLDEDARIVFLTSFKEYAYQGFQVRAYDYLLKPVQKETLIALLDRLAAEEGRTQQYIRLQSGKSVCRIPYSQLAYLEVNQKKLYFHQTDGQVRQIPGTIAGFEADLLARPEFVKIHRSYIVNLRHVVSLSPDGCALTPGDNLPISRLLYQQVRRQYIAYLFDDAEE